MSLHLQDHFEWPSLQRKDLMNLSKIVDEETVGLSKLRPARQSLSLTTSDIDGSRPFYKQNSPIRRRPIEDEVSPRHNTSNRHISPSSNDETQQNRRRSSEYFMRVDDINYNTMRKKPREIANDPLSPTYKLPSYIVSEHPQPKFIRDTLYIDDIDGVRAHPESYYQKTRNVDPYTPIDGAKFKPKFIPRDRSNTLDVADINAEGVFKSTRTTNPNMPSYNISTLLGGDSQEEYGYVKGSSSRILHPDLSKEKSFSLSTQDISGAQAHSLRRRIYELNNTRRHFGQPTRTDDILGAQPSTLKKGIQTLRSVNPNVPVYTLPGHSEIFNARPRSHSLVSSAKQTLAQFDTQQSFMENGNPPTPALGGSQVRSNKSQSKPLTPASPLSGVTVRSSRVLTEANQSALQTSNLYDVNTTNLAFKRSPTNQLKSNLSAADRLNAFVINK